MLCRLFVVINNHKHEHVVRDNYGKGSEIIQLCNYTVIYFLNELRFP